MHIECASTYTTTYSPSQGAFVHFVRKSALQFFGAYMCVCVLFLWFPRIYLHTRQSLLQTQTMRRRVCVSRTHSPQEERPSHDPRPSIVLYTRAPWLCAQHLSISVDRLRRFARIRDRQPQIVSVSKRYASFAFIVYTARVANKQTHIYACILVFEPRANDIRQCTFNVHVAREFGIARAAWSFNERRASARVCILNDDQTHLTNMWQHLCSCRTEQCAHVFREAQPFARARNHRGGGQHRLRRSNDRSRIYSVRGSCDANGVCRIVTWVRGGV